MVVLKNKQTSVRIDKGELVGYIVDGHEFIHQKGSPGWGSSDTEMFPIIGPVDQANFRVNTPRGEAIQDQHGLLRQFDYELISQSETSAVFLKKYKAGKEIKNSKYPEKSTEPLMSWPYDFQFEKSYHLTETGLELIFKITGEKDMPFMLGYHPAFKLHSESPIIEANNKEITLYEVLAVGSRALQVPDCTSITLKDKKEITITTKGFGNFMCWTEIRNMVCIEPITFYPYAVEQVNLNRGFQEVGEESVFKVVLTPSV